MSTENFTQHAKRYILNQASSVLSKCHKIKILLMWYEPAHDKTYNNSCSISEDSDQPAPPRSLIRVLADRMCLLQPPGNPERDTRETLPYWVDVQADQSLCWSHRSYYMYCRELLIYYVVSVSCIVIVLLYVFFVPHLSFFKYPRDGLCSVTGSHYLKLAYLE